MRRLFDRFSVWMVNHTAQFAGHQADCRFVFCIFITCRRKQKPTGGLLLPGHGSKGGSTQINIMWIIKSFPHCHALWMHSLQPPSLVFSFSLPSFPLVGEFAYVRPRRWHMCVAHPALTHWSLGSPLFECSLVSALMQSSPVISWELSVLHSLPSVLFFFLY